jgi:hypothetical protein
MSLPRSIVTASPALGTLPSGQDAGSDQRDPWSAEGDG